MKWLGQGVVYLGMYFVYSVTLGRPDRSMPIDWGSAFVWIGVGAVILMLGTFVLKQVNESTQGSRDAVAVELLANASNAVPTALFLRAFDITGKFVVSHAHENMFNMEKWERQGADPIERVLADAVSESVTLVGVGGRGEAEFGMGASGLLADWQTKIATAMDAASMIFVVPAPSPGTLWEIEQIISKGLLWKTIFLMPPLDGVVSYTGEGGFPKVWEAAKIACMDRFGLNVPEHDWRGAMFRFDDVKGPAVSVPFSGYFEPKRVAKTINRLAAVQV